MTANPPRMSFEKTTRRYQEHQKPRPLNYETALAREFTKCKTSWWTEPLDWHGFSQRAAEELPRMRSSLGAALVSGLAFDYLATVFSEKGKK